MELNENNKTTYLQELKGSDFQIAEHQPDITGWQITDGSGVELGEVKDLIFDSNALKVRYIVASLDLPTESDVDLPQYRLVLIPIGVADLDTTEDEVVVKELTPASVQVLPLYEPGKTISPVEELAVRYAFLGRASLPHADAVVYDNHPDDFYQHDHFDDTRYTRRQSDPDTYREPPLI